MTPKEREAWERGVADCANLITQNEPEWHLRARIMALTMGLLHGTLGPGPEAERKRKARALGVPIR